MCSVVASMTFNITNSHTITPSLTSTPICRQKQNPYSYHAFDLCTHFFLSFFACHNFFNTIYKSVISGYVLKTIVFVLGTCYWVMDSYFDLSFPFESYWRRKYSSPGGLQSVPPSVHLLLTTIDVLKTSGYSGASGVTIAGSYEGAWQRWQMRASCNSCKAL